ncbi:salviol synthase-like [Andrographis paniculata]|uniref:salviol synthase-like n=1 Tax=Andrographis paniculata TaxID=175694 RepID=UPI0021E901CB|nr:salviol synthase-like [Andrographis paniculata]
MYIDFSSLLTPLTFFIFLAAFFKVILRSKPDENSNLPPGPRKLPLIGNLNHLLTSSGSTHQVLSDLAAKHGPVMHLQLGQVSTIVISSAEAAQEVLKTHDIIFANRPWLVSTSLIFYKQKDIAFSSYGEYWRQLRKICTMELLSPKRVLSFQPLREKAISSMCKWIASKEGESINLTEKMYSAICNVLMQATFGSMTKELSAYIARIQDINDLASEFSLEDFYPSMRLFRLFSTMRSRANRLHKIIDTILENIINEHKAANLESKQRQEDLVDVLLKFNEEGHEHHLTIESVKAVLQDMITGGFDSSAATTDWAMAEMLKHPTVLKKAQDEVRHVFNNKGLFHESFFNELKYLKLVIKETLRLHPAGPLLLPRQSSKPCEIHGYKIPSNTRVLVNAWSIGRNPKYWNEADSFIPERFLDNQVDYKTNNFEFIPFGAGRRICPGIAFGLANVELPLAMLLYHFDWVLADGMKPENLDMEDVSGLVARRKNPLHVIPMVRNPLPVE